MNSTKFRWQPPSSVSDILRDERALPRIVPKATHEDTEVRFAAAFAFGCYADHNTAIQELTVLMKDADADVRDWATFGLGTQSNADSPEIRAALTERLTDSVEIVREEAMAGLAKRNEAELLPIQAQ